MTGKNIEKNVKNCYSSWSIDYYDNYYGAKAPYPPVHRGIIKRLLSRQRAKVILDAGCGPASFLRELDPKKHDLYGFDLTPEMVREAKRILGAKGIPFAHIWEGSVLSPASFRAPGKIKKAIFDAAICIGVFPHIHKDADRKVIKNLYNAVKKGGLVIIEARNQLFSLFSQNRYTYQFFINELMQLDAAPTKPPSAAVKALKDFKKHFRMDLPPMRTGSKDNPGYDEVLSRTHNPIVLKEQFIRNGFEDVQLLFYHYHCMPPMFETQAPDFFRKESLAMENPTDWRGYFMASAFLLAGWKS